MQRVLKKVIPAFLWHETRAEGKEKYCAYGDYSTMRQTNRFGVFHVKLLPIDVCRPAMSHFSEDITHIPKSLFYPTSEENHD